MAAGADVTCVIHAHSTYSDGTGTVSQIAAQAAEAGVDAVLLTDHDSLEAKRHGEERWWDRVLVCVGEEVSPQGGNHYLAFGIEEEIAHDGLDGQGIIDAVTAAGGFGFLAHPFSKGSERFKRAGEGMPWPQLESLQGYTGIELWSFATDGGEALRSVREAARFIAAPTSVMEGPPPANVRGWDHLLARDERVVAIGGVDAHQFGWRVGGRVPLKLMSYRRSFSQLRTHVLLDRAPSGDDAARDRQAIYAALRAGRCYLAMDSLAPAQGFEFEADGARMGEEAAFAEGAMLRARLPREAARIRLLRDGQVVAERLSADALDAPAERPGVYRVEATLAHRGRERTWVMSNPIYLR
jgi:PHP domain-containing protein